jgi:carboxylate-amine ligase
MMSDGSFSRNDWPTLGVELELQLIDARTMALKSAISDLLANLPADLHGSVKRELMQCYVEINSAACRTVAEVGEDLSRKIRAVEAATDRCGVRLFWAGTHPFSHWRGQEITPDDRYHQLAETLREAAVRHVVFGLHVHVGVDSGDKAALICDRLQRHLPLLLALSANSPFWCGRSTGFHSHRIGILGDSPFGGSPPPMRSWGAYRAQVDRLFAAGFIRSVKDLWWDLRPNATYGTVEIRVCDMPPDLPSVLALAALIQCLVRELSEEIDRGVVVPDDDPLLTRQNRWRASRYGLDANLVDPFTLEATPARRAAENLASRLWGQAGELGCVGHLEQVLEMAARPTGSERQLALYADTGDLFEVVRRLVGPGWQTGEASEDTSVGWPPYGMDGPAARWMDSVTV